MDISSMLLVLIALIGGASFAIFPMVKQSWMQTISRLLIISLPFERIPSVDAAGVSIRISQVLVLIGVWFFCLLVLKKDQKILSLKIKSVNYFLFWFLVFAIPSFFYVTNERRFLTTMIATLLVFLATFIISQFEKNPFARIKELSISILVASVFGAYQFAGDMIGLPISLTGLRESYTKAVFGIPRIQGTALEPLYFAGMLFLPIIAALVFTATKKRLILPIKNLPGWLTNNTIVFIFLTLISLGTNSKAALVILGLIVMVLLLFLMMKLQIGQLVKKISWLLGLVVFGGLGVVLYIPNIREALGLIIYFFWLTIIGQAPSAVERLAFIDTFNQILPDFIVTGIGSGQFGPRAIEYIPFLKANNNITAIVNNVYLEIWLEFGLISAVIFIVMLCYVIIKNLRHILHQKDWYIDKTVAQIILVFSLIAYCLQWLTFSPIFIMPIFIILGLLESIDNN